MYELMITCMIAGFIAVHLAAIPILFWVWQRQADDRRKEKGYDIP